MRTTVEIRHFHLFCGLGGAAKGMNKGKANVGNLHARFRCTGGVDVDASAIRDFDRLSGARGTVIDLFDEAQYYAFHGKRPPADWKPAMPEDIFRASGFEFPDIVCLSPPCKGFSGLLSECKSKSDRYQALNQLTLRGIWLTLEAFKDNLPALIWFENVPRIANRGRYLLDQICALLRSYGYAVAETTHDCGNLGGLSQSRKRYLLVARHMEKVPSFLYEPLKRPLRSVGDVFSLMPRPGDPLAGPMHRIPNLQWKTWVRLAFVEAGSDWRSLNKLAVENGFLRDYAIVPEGSAEKCAVANPKKQGEFFGKYAVTAYNRSSGTVISGSTTGQGAYAVADPLPGFKNSTHESIYRVVPWGDSSKVVTGACHTAGGAPSVADPYFLQGWGGGQSQYAVANLLPGIDRGKGDHYLTAGHYGVRRWTDTSGAVSASACHDNGFFSIADPFLPAASAKLLCVIRALDNCWHRPMTTLELAVLQSLIDPEEQLELDGLSDSAWRERIGNAVPPSAAQAIAEVMGQVLLLTLAGETFSMNSSPIWVRPTIAALMVAQG